MKTGKVKWFNAQKGFGFIIQEDGTDIFVHFKDVDGGVDGIAEHDTVSYEVGQGKKGPQAIKVKRV
ncbi:cold-shock protein [Olivibacter sitiensis]|uniref:cold-shock protein n=1 Tax=Olivibacter sitiensis TaxID=376470 RepID=UPI00040BFB06|nr:cold-shock protein [Olivibacter sitiensis]